MRGIYRGSAGLYVCSRDSVLGYNDFGVFGDFDVFRDKQLRRLRYKLGVTVFGCAFYRAERNTARLVVGQYGFRRLVSAVLRIYT